MELRLPTSPMLGSCRKASKKVTAVALKRVCPAPLQPESPQKKSRFAMCLPMVFLCLFYVSLLVLFLFLSGDLFQSCCGSTWLCAQKRFCCGLKGLKAPLFALGQGPPRGARANCCIFLALLPFNSPFSS